MEAGSYTNACVSQTSPYPTGDMVVDSLQSPSSKHIFSWQFFIKIYLIYFPFCRVDCNILIFIFTSPAQTSIEKH